MNLTINEEKVNFYMNKIAQTALFSTTWSLYTEERVISEAFSNYCYYQNSSYLK